MTREDNFDAIVEPALCVAGDISYASSTYRLFKLPKTPVKSGATVTYKGTVADFPDQLDFDSSHCFKVQLKAHQATILNCFINIYTAAFDNLRPTVPLNGKTNLCSVLFKSQRKKFCIFISRKYSVLLLHSLC